MRIYREKILRHVFGGQDTEEFQDYLETRQLQRTDGKYDDEEEEE